MTAVDIMARHLPEREVPEAPQGGVCCVTGAVCETLPKGLAISTSFNDLALLRAPSSDRIGVDAWRVLTYSEPNPGKKRDLYPLRNSSWVVTDEGLELLNRQGVRRHALGGVDAKVWAGYATTSYKKHGVLRTPLNSGAAAVWLFETLPVDCTDRTQVKECWDTMRAAQDAGVHRPIIETLDIGAGYIGKVGVKLWLDFERWARPRLRSPLYQFLCYLLPSQEELKGGGRSEK